MRRTIRLLLQFIALRALRVSTTYSQHNVMLLKRGRVIVCANHISLLDGLIVALASPAPLVFGVDTDFSKRSWLIGWCLAALSFLGFGRVVPIDGNSPFGVRAMYKALSSGESVMIFPEGRISETGDPLPEQPGVKWLAERACAPIVRVQISGAENSRIFAKAGRAFWPAISVSF